MAGITLVHHWTQEITFSRSQDNGSWILPKYRSKVSKGALKTNDSAPYHVTTKQEAHSIIKDCLEANNSWVDTFNELGCILAFDLDPMLEGSATVDFIIDDLWKKGIRATQDEVVKSICSYAIENNYVWSVETIFDNFDYTAKTLDNLGEDSKELLKDMAEDTEHDEFKKMVKTL